jgi:hypothetical protein
MTTYNTGNPLGSVDVKDLYDNSQNLDELVNSQTKLSEPDRLGVARKTWKGMETDFAASLVDQEERFQEALAEIGYEFLGDYAADISVTQYNQLIKSGGEWWRLSASATLPYTTTGAGMPEGGNFVPVGEAVLRQDLASTATGKGGELVSFKQLGTGAVDRTALDKMRDWVSVKDFGAVGDGVADDTAAIQAAIDAVFGGGGLQGGNIYFPKGSYRVTSSIYQKPRVNFLGDGSRKSRIVWGATNLSNYQKGVVYCVAGTDASPDFVFSTCIEGLSIDAGGNAPVALAIRGHQENCRFVELSLSQFTDAGLEALPFAMVNHGITFADLHIIPADAAVDAYGMRLSHVQKCIFDNITTDIANPGHYEYGIYLYNTPLLNTFRGIHTEDCRYGIYMLGGANNVFIGIEAKNNVLNGITHFYTTGSRYSISAMRTILGFANHYDDTVRQIEGGADTDSVTIERGANHYRRIADRETYIGQTSAAVTLHTPRLTRGVDAYAGVTGNGQTYLRINANIPASSTRYIEIDLGSPSVGFAGK